ncbi:MAG: hypothetical protein J6Q31_00295 [Alistipes sp.]|nr:hypothetical protein [Alistipes sp.]
MNWKFILLYVLMVMVSSSCNIDEDITAGDDTSQGGYRPKGTNSQATCNYVFEYTPAPGQFINEDKSGFTGEDTASEAAAYALKRLNAEKYVSLGGFGGYIVVGFDHSIDNYGGYDFAIKGNSFDGSSEPGIVWVMQDANENGKPDDTWYELKGSETGKEATIQNYSVTYFRPTESNSSVRWEDSLGEKGEISRVPSHKQDSYYPAWIKEDSYTLYGTRLEARNYDKSDNGTMWINPAYDWGYADNASDIDRLINDDNNSAAAVPNHFRISDAIDSNGKSVELQWIDFVKVQTGTHTQSGWLGEHSTEVFSIYDCNMIE